MTDVTVCNYHAQCPVNVVLCLTVNCV